MTDNQDETIIEPPFDTVKSNALDCEFLYYSSVLKVVAPALTNESDREYVIPWIQKLFRPEYHSSILKEKRNLYLLCLTITLMNDEVVGIFEELPPNGPLLDLASFPEPKFEAASWERDKMWEETLQAIPDHFEPLECSVHNDLDECKRDHKLDRILDQEFMFLLYLARPYAALMLTCEDRTKMACWIQTLCTIYGRNFCSSMKAIRNDYIMALLGYLCDLRAVGPFTEKPPWKQLKSLAEAAKDAYNTSSILDPTSATANDFLKGQPVPEDGAFCYVALTGELIQSNFGGPGA